MPRSDGYPVLARGKTKPSVLQSLLIPGILLAVILSMGVGSLRFALAVQNARIEIRRAAFTTMDVFRPMAIRAAYSLDAVQAEELVETAMAHPMITEMRLWDDFGNLMAGGSREVAMPFWKPVTRLVGADHHSLSLVRNPGGPHVGRMEFRVDATRTIRAMALESIRTFVFSFCQNLLMLGLIAGRVGLRLARPLRTLAGAVRMSGAESTAPMAFDPERVTVDEMSELLRAIGNWEDRHLDARESLRSDLRECACVFEESPVALLLADFSDTRYEIEKLGTSGVSDFEREMDEHPDLLPALVRKVRILDANPAALSLFGVSEKPLLAMRLTDTFSDASLMTFGKPMAAIWNGDVRTTYKTDVKNRAGRIRHVSIGWHAIPESGSGYSRVLISIEDITDRIRLAQRIREVRKADADRTRSGKVAHDLNNLLSPIIGHTELVLTDPALPEGIRPQLEEVAAAGRQARDLVRRFHVVRRHKYDAQPERPGDRLPESGQERILVVDDEPGIVSLLVASLSPLGYAVGGATSSREALDRFDAEHWDLVITDMTMPEMSGERLVEAILSRKPDTAVILCTGFSHTMDEKRARAIGVRAFLTKPVLRDELTRTIRKVLDETSGREGTGGETENG